MRDFVSWSLLGEAGGVETITGSLSYPVSQDWLAEDKV